MWLWYAPESKLAAPLQHGGGLGGSHPEPAAQLELHVLVISQSPGSIFLFSYCTTKWKMTPWSVCCKQLDQITAGLYPCGVVSATHLGNVTLPACCSAKALRWKSNGGTTAVASSALHNLCNALNAQC